MEVRELFLGASSASFTLWRQISLVSAAALPRLPNSSLCAVYNKHTEVLDLCERVHIPPDLDFSVHIFMSLHHSIRGSLPDLGLFYTHLCVYSYFMPLVPQPGFPDFTVLDATHVHMFEYECVHAMACVCRSEDCFWYQALPPTLLETGSLQFPAEYIRLPSLGTSVDSLVSDHAAGVLGLDLYCHIQMVMASGPHNPTVY